MRNLVIDSPLSGRLIELSEVNDEIFSSGAAGRGMAIKNPAGKIFAPFEGTIKFLASPGVIGIESFSGVEMLIHVGLDTCKLKGKSFKPRVTAGDRIRRGQILLTFEPQEISRAGFDTTTPVVVTNHEIFGDIIFQLGRQKIIIRTSSDKVLNLPRRLRKLFEEFRFTISDVELVGGR